MTTKVEQWITEGKRNGTLVANFIDCQVGMLCYDDIPAVFNNVATLGNDLRSCAIPITHFMMDICSTRRVSPFQYGDRLNDPSLIRSPSLDFTIAVPTDDEWVYAKNQSNGYTNPYSDYIINHDHAEGCVVVMAGAFSNDCVGRTMAGSFARAINPIKHFVILANDATDQSDLAMHRAKTEMAKFDIAKHYQTNITEAPAADIMRLTRQ